MKALYKEQLIKCIECNFESGELIFENEKKLKEIWSQLAHEWHIVNGKWEETKFNDVWRK